MSDGTEKRAITEAEFERIADVRIQQRLRGDIEWLNAENAGEQDRAEERVSKRVISLMESEFEVVR
jgi:hypothetical protein